MKGLVAVSQLALCFMLVFCNSGDGQTRPPELTGQWEHASGATRGKPEKLELFKDGTGVVDGRGSVTWKVENKRFVILSPLFALSCNYKVSGYELALVYDDGASAIFVRKGKLEEFWSKQAAAAAAEAKKAKKARLVAAAETVNAELIADAKKAKASIGTFTDKRDGKSYKKVTIGSKTWMVENLNFAAEGSKCYENDAGNCEKYGRLYNWATALKACPAGFHLPTDGEWTALTDAVGGESTAGRRLKSAAGWNEDGNGTNDFGFSALPGGNGYSDGSFGTAGNFGDWWSATEDNANDAWSRNMIDYFESDVFRIIYGKAVLLSVRCVQDD